MFALNFLIRLGIKFAREESGATAIEYSLIAALVSVAALGAFHSLGSAVNLMYNGVIAPLVTAAMATG